MSLEKKAGSQDIKDANKDLYNAIAEDYERIDGRRTPELSDWLTGTLKDIRSSVNGGLLLDIGAGSGFLTRCSEGIFTDRIALDLSRKILAKNQDSFDPGVCGDLERLPFADGAFDAVTCFSVLHHLYGYKDLISEIARVLKPGGVFYSDHDMEGAFRSNFAVPIAIFRALKSRRTKKLLAEINVSYEMYELSEFRSDGVPSAGILSLLSEAGFEVRAKYHWFGTFGFLGPILGDQGFPKGLAPLLQIRAVKK